MNFCQTASASRGDCSDGFCVDRDHWNAWLGLGAPAGLLGPLAGAIVVVSMVEPLNGGLTAALAGGGAWLVLSVLIALTVRCFTADRCRMRGPS